MTSSLLRRGLASAASVLRQQSSLLGSVAAQRMVSTRVPVTLVPGDGVGPEIADAVQAVFKAAGVPVDFETFFLSEIHRSSSVSLSDVCASIARTGVCLKGTLGTPDFSSTGELDSLNMRFRKELDLFANVVRVQSIPGVSTRHHNIDFVIIREQLEGEYSALEHETVPGVVECMKIVTEARSLRIAKFAFDYATKHGRKKVTAVHKANIMKLGDGTFLRSCDQISRLYPNIKYENVIIDNCATQMVGNPQQFDVMVMMNLYGDVLSNIAAGLVGGAGVLPGECYSANAVCFEPGCRHMFAQAAGKNVANPTALLLASANMLDHCNLSFYGRVIREAVDKVLRTGKKKTKDLGGQGTTTEFTHAVINNLRFNELSN